MQKEIENLEFVRGENFDFINSLKNNGTKYLLNFDDSCEKICNSKAFVDIATAGRHRGLSTIYIKHKLLHQSKLERDVELQKFHIVLFKSPRDVMQVTTLSTELGVGSELVDWYRDATSVPFGHLLIDLSPRTDERLRYCTNTDRIHSLKILNPRPTETVISFGRSTHKIFLLSECSNQIPTNSKVFFFSLAQKSSSAFFANAY